MPTSSDDEEPPRPSLATRTYGGRQAPVPAASETPPTTVSPTPASTPLTNLKDEIAEARARENKTRDAADKASQESKELTARAKKCRDKAKAKEGKKKELLASIKELQKRGREYNAEAKSRKTIFFELDEEVDELQMARQMLESKLKDLEYEEMLLRCYPDPVIRKLKKKMDLDGDILGIFESVMSGRANLEDIDALKAELDGICQVAEDEAADLAACEYDVETTKEKDSESKYKEYCPHCDFPSSRRSDTTSHISRTAWTSKKIRQILPLRLGSPMKSPKKRSSCPNTRPTDTKTTSSRKNWRRKARPWHHYQTVRRMISAP